MKAQGRPNSQECSSETQNSSKKKYQKPSFRHEKVFETMALACSKVSRTEGQCHFGTRKSS
jgi:hypothetical protein